MKPKDIRRLLADAREKKQVLMARNLKIDWCKSAFLMNPSTLKYVIDYFQLTQDSFALRYDREKDLWYLFDVHILSDSSMAEESPPELAIVLEMQRRW